MATTNRYDYVSGTDVENLVQGVSLTLDEAKAEIDRIFDVFDVNYATVDELPILGAIFGFEIDTREDPEYQRKLLKTAIDVIKTKGTWRSFQIIFQNLGFNVEIVPQWTASFYEEVEVELPYIRVDDIPAMDEGSFEVTVMNPDEQYHTLANAIHYHL